MNTDKSENPSTYALSLTGEGVEIKRELDRETATQVIALVVGGAIPAPSGSGSPPSPAKRTRQRKRARSGSDSKPTKQRRAGPKIVKDLSLRPQGKKAFREFANEKQPKTHQQKQTVAVYWLRHEASLEEGITTAHVNTCYRAASWKRPNDLGNSLSVTAAKRGWLDTSDRENIMLTVAGEDFVTHELPSQEK